MRIENHVITSLSSGGAQKVLLHLIKNRAQKGRNKICIYFIKDGVYRTTFEQIQGVKLVQLGLKNVASSFLFNKKLRANALVVSWLYHADILCLLFKLINPRSYWISNVRNGDLGRGSSISSKFAFFILKIP